jgi:hypothetical protein
VTVLGLLDDRARYTLRDDHDGLFAASDWGTRPLFGPGRMDVLEQLADGYYYLVVAGAVAGLGVLIASRRRLAGTGWLFFVLTAPVQLVSPLATFGEPRFKMPIYPVLAVVAAVAIVAAVRRDRWLEPACMPEPETHTAAMRAGPPSPAGDPADPAEGVDPSPVVTG